MHLRRLVVVAYTAAVLVGTTLLVMLPFTYYDI
jgi:hypothetical protein